MNKWMKTVGLVSACALAGAVLVAQDIKVDLSKETVGKTPTTFEPFMGTWVIAQDGPDKVVKVDGTAYLASKTTPERLLLQNARKLYGSTNEELIDNAKQFTFFPVAVLKSVDKFSNGTISVKFKTLSGEIDRASGILFNVKPNGDWLCVRFQEPESNVVIWEFHNGVRRQLKRSASTFKPDRALWHELKMTVNGADFKAWLDNELALEYTLGSAPGPGRNGAAPNPDLFPENNPVIRPPVDGKVGLWAKGDTTSEFKDYVIVKK